MHESLLMKFACARHGCLRIREEDMPPFKKNPPARSTHSRDVNTQAFSLLLNIRILHRWVVVLGDTYGSDLRSTASLCSVLATGREPAVASVRASLGWTVTLCAIRTSSHYRALRTNAENEPRSKVIQNIGYSPMVDHTPLPRIFDKRSVHSVVVEGNTNEENSGQTCVSVASKRTE
jgi:hypothetical protein